MEKYNEIYNRNKKLDNIFIDKYIAIEDKLYEKNCLELIVELCELANESKCFKYWTIKKSNRELVLEEFADSLLMVFYMFNTYNIKCIELIDIDISGDIIYSFNELIRMCTCLMDRNIVTERFLKEIFSKLIRIGRLLELSEDEIVDACLKKIVKIEERLDSDY